MHARILLDVRTKEEYMAGNVPGSMHIPLAVLQESLHMIAKEKQIVVFCASGARAMIAKDILERAHFNVVVGGSWQYVHQLCQSGAIDSLV